MNNKVSVLDILGYLPQTEGVLSLESYRSTISFEQNGLMIVSWSDNNGNSVGEIRVQNAFHFDLPEPLREIIHDEFNAGHETYVTDISVSEDYRGKGVGSQILAHGVLFLSRTFNSFNHLIRDSSNGWAISRLEYLNPLMESNGFQSKTIWEGDISGSLSVLTNYTEGLTREPTSI